MKVELVEVGPRDGLQNETVLIPLGVKIELIERLAKVGLRRIEAGAFVSPQWVPQMKESDQVIRNAMIRHKFAKKTRLSALVPNEKGMLVAEAVGLREVAVFTAASETFSRRNTNCTIEESFRRINPVLSRARRLKMKVRGYISTCFGCPFEGRVSELKVLRLTERLLNLGVKEVSIGDTIGVATPKQVRGLVKKLVREFGMHPLALHFHDTRGTALANIVAGLDLGVRVFDSSVGGLGGCPYAPGASGNVATEDVVYLCHGLGVRTGVDLHELIALSRWIGQKMGRKLPSRLGQAGVPLHL